jgi:hypothetical protein
VTELHFIEAIASPPNNRVELTCQNRTVFAYAKTPPFWQAAHAWR